VQVRSSNAKNLRISDIEYAGCVESLLDVCGVIHCTYTIPLGTSTIKVPIHLGVGEAIRVLFARITGNKKRRNLMINASAAVHTSNPKLQDTFVRFEKWNKAVLFRKKQKQPATGRQQTASQQPKPFFHNRINTQKWHFRLTCSRALLPPCHLLTHNLALLAS